MNEVGPGMDLDHALTTTRTVRKRLDLRRPMERSIVEACLATALQAPNGSNKQLYRWILVDDPDVRAGMAEIYRTSLFEYAGRSTPARNRPFGAADEKIADSVMHLAEHLHEVPVLVVPAVHATLEGAELFYQASHWGSVLPAVWSFMLALRKRGLGSAWTTVHLWRADEMAALLGIPGGYTQAGLFPVAYTVGTEFKPAARRPLTDVAHWNSFGNNGL